MMSHTRLGRLGWLVGWLVESSVGGNTVEEEVVLEEEETTAYRFI